jgi:hypothetical protein
MYLASFASWLSYVSILRFTLSLPIGSLGALAASYASHSAFNAATVDIPDFADMERGFGGRIEEAFAASKEAGEAAFVTFITAGYPCAAGRIQLSSVYSTLFSLLLT